MDCSDPNWHGIWRQVFVQIAEAGGAEFFVELVSVAIRFRQALIAVSRAVEHTFNQPSVLPRPSSEEDSCGIAVSLHERQFRRVQRGSRLIPWGTR